VTDRVQGSEQLSESKSKHRRERNVQIIAPVAGAGIVALLILLITLVGRHDEQINVVASCMFPLIFLPLFVLCVLPYAVLLVGIYGFAGVYRRADSLLGGAVRLTAGIKNTTQRASRGIGNVVIAANTRFAFLERILGGNPSSTKHVIESKEIRAEIRPK
jgi:hypothetical protein